MQLINTLFLKIVSMSLTAGIVILVVMFVRILIKKLPKSFTYMLWLVVAFRLIVPVSADADISIFNLFEHGSVYNENWRSKSEIIRVRRIADTAESFCAAVRNLADEMNIQKPQGYAKSGIEGNYSVLLALYLKDFSDNTNISDENVVWAKMRDSSVISIMAWVWIAGILAFALYAVFAHTRIKRQIRYGIRLYDNVYECGNIRSPFVFGVISPKIYLPFRLSEREQQCILAHEQYHIKRKDYLIKSITYMLVIIYWFHPLIWIAYRMMCIDMEMSCDEKIISGLTVDMRKEYSRLLLAFSVNKRQLQVSPLAFGEENTMKRIKYILDYKKPARWKLAGGAVIMMITMAACATDATDKDETSAFAPDKIIAMKNESMGTGDNHVIEHQQAQWAENSACDYELCSLDYADSDKIVFHISSGLFEYDLQEQRIVNSIDLKALNCQAVQTGGECRITVYQDDGSGLRVVMTPYPYSDADSYIYDLEKDELFVYDASLLEGYTMFDSLVSKYDLPEDERLKGWRHAEYILPLEDRTYGILRWETIELGTMYYEAGGQKWELFHKEQATLPKLLKQDDSFYQSFAINAGKNISQCEIDYTAFYNGHDYAGVCALSTELTYSDEIQQEFSERSDILWGGQEVSHSEDEKEYLFQYTCADDYGADGEKVYVNFKYHEGQGWRAEGLPTTQDGDFYYFRF